MRADLRDTVVSKATEPRSSFRHGATEFWAAAVQMSLSTMRTRGAGVPDWQREERVTIDVDAHRILGREVAYCMPWEVSARAPPPALQPL